MMWPGSGLSHLSQSKSGQLQVEQSHPVLGFQQATTVHFLLQLLEVDLDFNFTILGWGVIIKAKVPQMF